jgi:hypothetical protein
MGTGLPVSVTIVDSLRPRPHRSEACRKGGQSNK